MSFLQTNKMWRVILSLLAVTAVVRAYPSGAPSTACTDMFPQHGPSEQTSTPPYELVVDKTTYAGGEEVQVTLQRTGNSATFKGFFIQARTVGSTDAQGRFTTLDSGTTKTVNCGSEANSENGVTHTGRTEKTEVAVTWTAPANRVGHIQFRATVVQTETVFWVSEVTSAYVEDPTAGPVPTPASSDSQDVGVTSNGCGSTKGCYQAPTNCAPPSCEYFSSWQTSGDSVLFEVSGTSNGYVAVGISADNTMGLDDIYECVYNSDSGDTTVYSSWSTGKSMPERDTTQPQGGISTIVGSYVEGVVSCKFTRSINDAAAGRRKRQAKVNNGRFYDLNDDFYVLMSKGSTSGNALSYHATNRVVSSGKVDFQSNTQVTGAGSPDIVKAHGSLMMIAWICTASVGVLMARFFKHLWPDSQLCKEKVWFAIHRAMMISTVLLTIIAFILIMTYNNWLWAFHAGAHAIVGIIVVILALINPLMALARPHPDQPKRFIFNWAHWAVGTAARILGVVAIFLGMDLAALDLPPAATFLMVGWVIWHALAEVVLEIHNCSTSSKPGRSEEMEMDTAAGDPKAKPLRGGNYTGGHGIRKGILGLYVLGMLGFLIALLVYVGLN
ncbi:putative ferric-chelate reductase 1 isoform X1 [Branchiostoma lanceolatum]|uniref:putative ferric-chelate reductase 1 isoform X1 n=2 Tax=Branchiostoma lanceolatum TaxID=7740 RepID=UPI0034543E0E